MKLFNKNSRIIFTALFGVLLGLSFPFAFIMLDLKQLGLNFTYVNMYEIFKSQYIYMFSTILFPILFTALSFLYWHTLNQNKNLARQELYIKNILNSLNDSILVCSANGNIEYGNLGFYDLFGTEETSITHLLSISNLDKIKYGYLFEMVIVDKDSKIKTVNFIIFKLNDKSIGNNSDQYIISIRDISNIKMNEDTILSQQQQLFEASKLSALGEMASGFAHEINNPLAIIKGNLMQLERGIKQETIKVETLLKNIQVCSKTVERVAKIIKGLQNLAHNTSSHEVSSFTVKELVEDPITMATLKMSGKGIRLIINIERVEDLVIFCNGIQISQVLMNFLGNSIDAIENLEDPWLSLNVVANENDVKFIIMDSGAGIPEVIQKKMFEPMFTTKPIGKGTGLGLSISRSIIENHHGKISINNDVENTCFEITIPRNFQVDKKAA